MSRLRLRVSSRTGLLATLFQTPVFFSGAQNVD